MVDRQTTLEALPLQAQLEAAEGGILINMSICAHTLCFRLKENRALKIRIKLKDAEER